MWTAIAYIGAALLGALGTYAATKKSNQTSQEISNQNIEFQEKENEITRLREDNAQQRAAADLEAAGLSKTLAAGNPASAAALTAPQASYQNESAIGRAIEKANLKESVLALDSHKADIAQKKAETDRIKAETAMTNLTTQTYMEKFANEQKLTLAQIDSYKAQIHAQESQAKLNEIEGEHRGEYLSLQIDRLIAENANTRMSSHEIAARISKILGETEKLDYEKQLLVEDIAKAKLEQQSIQLDINYAMKYGLPVGSMANGAFGSILTGTRSLADQFFKVVDKLHNRNTNFTFNPAVYYDLDGNPAYMTYDPAVGGGHAW